MTRLTAFRFAAALTAAATLPALVGAPARPAAPSAAPAAKSARGSAPLDPAVREILDRFARAQDAVRALRAEVVESRQLALLEKPEELRGEILYQQPGKVRWEYRTPEQRVYVLKDGKLTGWIPGKNRVERLNVSRYEGRLRKLLALGQDADELDHQFQIALVTPSAVTGADELALVPRSRRVRKKLKDIHLWIERASALPKQLRWETGDGDTVQLTLTTLALNPALGADAFTLRIPDGAQEVRGFSGFGMVGLTDDAQPPAGEM